MIGRMFDRTMAWAGKIWVNPTFRITEWKTRRAVLPYCQSATGAVEKFAIAKAYDYITALQTMAGWTPETIIRLNAAEKELEQQNANDPVALAQAKLRYRLSVVDTIQNNMINNPVDGLSSKLGQDLISIPNNPILATMEGLFTPRGREARRSFQAAGFTSRWLGFEPSAIYKMTKDGIPVLIDDPNQRDEGERLFRTNRVYYMEGTPFDPDNLVGDLATASFSNNFLF